MQTDTALLSVDQALIFAIFGFAMVAFVWGRLRYDVVALTALVAAVLVGVVKADDAFMGFSQSAVITVALVLVLSRALQDSGVIDHLAGPLERLSDRPLAFMAALTGIAALLSGFMNNVGALALLMPVVMRW